MTQAGRQTQDAGKPEYELRARQARIAAGARRFSVDLLSVVTEAPPPLHEFKADFEAHPRSELMMAEGWRVALIDLRGVVRDAAQRHTPIAGSGGRSGGLRGTRGRHPQDASAADPQRQLREGAQGLDHRGADPELPDRDSSSRRRSTATSGSGSRCGSSRPSFRLCASRTATCSRTATTGRSLSSRVGSTSFPHSSGEGSVEDIGEAPGMFSPSARLAANAPVIPDFFDDDVSAAVRLPVLETADRDPGLETTLTE